ncbi:MAG: 50S ribosomal protein L6 [Patescibacteria group bacterium]
MSKIGKRPIHIPQGATVTLDGTTLTVKGPKGTLTRTLSGLIDVAVEGALIQLTPRMDVSADAKTKTITWGLERATLNNMLMGVTTGFTKVLEFNGVGYKAVPQGKNLELSLGFSHTIPFPAPEGIQFSVEKNVLTITGTDKEVVGQVAAEIRALKKPEPYKGSGIRYQGEVIKQKAGKKAIASS